jgi:urease accessory protein
MQSLLATLQLADSFFPSGMYTQSHGLETLVADGYEGASAIGALLESYLLDVIGPCEAVATRYAARAATQGDLALVAAIDARLEASRASTEGRVASRRCGIRLLTLGNDLYSDERISRYAAHVAGGGAPGHQTIALALLAVAAGLDEHTAVIIELHTFAVSLLSAAVRLGALDHIAAQHLLAGGRATLSAAAAIGCTTDWRDMASFAPQIEIAQLRHAYGATHMFVS